MERDTYWNNGDLTLTPMFGYTRFELDVETTIIDMNDILKVNVIKNILVLSNYCQK